ncbi:MAG TPA: Lrp/AsnC family transcriptional regulator [Candidatus Bathyarchaeota archaeon]|nr:Lrp/AsnC family transcriptional regulator [Candidatus Bathyarchaeota archaeon]HEX69257.1 Lrp/AsnC family transcriptional regulator [Candidatus Bathyarchaeota archaeon]
MSRTKEIPSGRSLRLLQTLLRKGKPATVYTIRVKQSELARQLGISRQALNVHLRKLRDLGYVRTGRGFIDITEEGLNILGISANPAFIFVKISPHQRREAYKKMMQIPVQRLFRVAGDMDAVLILEQEKLNETLQRLSEIDGITDTRSYVTIQTIK